MDAKLQSTNENWGLQRGSYAPCNVPRRTICTSEVIMLLIGPRLTPCTNVLLYCPSTVLIPTYNLVTVEQTVQWVGEDRRVLGVVLTPHCSVSTG